MTTTPRARIEIALQSYLPFHSARLRSIELARILKETADQNEARDLISEKLGQCDIFHDVPEEIREHVVELVIQAWQVIPLDPGK